MINWDAYKEGSEAWDLFRASSWTEKEMNPYVLGHIKWESWNRGWNTNFNGIEKQQNDSQRKSEQSNQPA